MRGGEVNEVRVGGADVGMLNSSSIIFCRIFSGSYVGRRRGESKLVEAGWLRYLGLSDCWSSSSSSSRCRLRVVERSEADNDDSSHLSVGLSSRLPNRVVERLDEDVADSSHEFSDTERRDRGYSPLDDGERARSPSFLLVDGRCSNEDDCSRLSLISSSLHSRPYALSSLLSYRRIGGLETLLSIFANRVLEAPLGECTAPLLTPPLGPFPRSSRLSDRGLDPDREPDREGGFAQTV